MPKQKFSLSKKHEKLIDIEVNVPTIQELRSMALSREFTIIDHKGNAEDSLVMALKTISQGTQYEDTCNGIISKCKAIFEPYNPEN